MPRQEKPNPYEPPRCEPTGHRDVGKVGRYFCRIACIVCAFFAVLATFSSATFLMLLFVDRMTGGEADWVSLALTTGLLCSGVLYAVAARAWWKHYVVQAIVLTVSTYLLDAILARIDLVRMGVLETFWTLPFGPV